MEQEALQECILHFEASCRRAGLKLTQQRIEIFRELAISTDHPSAEALHGRLIARMPTLSLDTVYRTLASFNQHGLAQKVETAESQARYEVVHERHHHLICRHCHDIVDFHWPSIDDLDLPDGARTWGRIESRNVVIYGICGKCSLSEIPDNRKRINP
jgi:Fur family peroxide stress response transcriptional regulator